MSAPVYPDGEPVLVTKAMAEKMLTGQPSVTGNQWKMAFIEAELMALEYLGMKDWPTTQDWNGGATFTARTYTHDHKWLGCTYRITWKAGWARHETTGSGLIAGQLDAPNAVQMACIRVAESIWKARNLDSDSDVPDLSDIQAVFRPVSHLLHKYRRSLPVAGPDRFVLLEAWPIVADSLEINTVDTDGNYTNEYTPGEIDLNNGTVDLWQCNSEFFH